MRHPSLRVIALVSFCLFCISLSAQSKVRSRITQPVDEAQRITLKGNIHPLARSQYDRGAASSDLPMQRMLLVLKRSPEQQAELNRLLDAQQDRSSPRFHQWLSPKEFGLRFGPSDEDIQAITSWLQASGFELGKVSNGRTVVEFSGTAGQVEHAFHSPIHRYVVGGEAHWANSTELQIPAALAPVVAGVHTLHNFRKKPMHHLSNNRVYIPPQIIPEITGSDGSHALVPADFATIYDISRLYSSGVNGQSANIAVVGRTNLNMQDVKDFHRVFNLPFTFVNVFLNGPDPGIISTDEQAEATLDVSWSSAVAPNAMVTLVVSQSTNSTDGVDLSELYIVDNNAGDIMTESFGQCEAHFTAPEASAISMLAEQAAAEGITYLVSTGDSGALGCDNPNQSHGIGPVSPNMLASTPFNVAVGGTMFNEHGQPTVYWNTTNDPTDKHSAKSYIPENAWNESCTAGCPQFPPPLAASGGGMSTFFSKPSWQSGVTGIPNDGARDQPDVSFTAAGHDGYLLCLIGSCEQGEAFLILGTSASAPTFAGVMALVDQKMGSGGLPQRQGQANYVLYRLAAGQNLSACNGSSTTSAPDKTCIFHDVTSGNIAVPGESGFGTASAKYQAGKGYDLATGLGSVDVANLVNNWSVVTFTPTVTTLDLTPKSGITHGASVNVSATVAPSGSASGTPTGDISLRVPEAGSERADTFPLTNGSVNLPTRGLPGGIIHVIAHYSGDGVFAPSDSVPVIVTVNPENTDTTLNMQAFDLSGNAIGLTGIPYGFPLIPSITVTGRSGVDEPRGVVTLGGEAGDSIGDPGLILSNQGTTHPDLPITTIPAGSHSMVAQYVGDFSFNGSSSSPSTFSVVTAGTTATVNIPGNGTVGSRASVPMTVVINTQSAGNPPSGLVEFFNGSNSLGSAPVGARLNGGFTTPTQFNLAQSQAVLTIPLPTGQDVITAHYQGDANYKPSTTPAISVTVQPDFDFNASSSNLLINAPGGSGTLTLTITGDTGYNSTVNFSTASCTGLPREAKCSFSPASVTGNGSTTMTLATTAPKSANSRGFGWQATTGVTFAGVLLASCRRRRRWAMLMAFATLLAIMPIMSCGGGSGSGGGSGDSGTPVGNFNVTISAQAGALSHSVTIVLGVQ